MKFEEEGAGELLIKSSGWNETAFNITVRQISCIGADSPVRLRAGIESCDDIVR